MPRSEGVSKTNSPVVFLDIDGVLVTWGSMHGNRRHPEYKAHLFDRHCVEMLNRITDATGAKVVVSSTWRRNRDFDALIAYLKDQGVRAEVIGKTPILDDYANGIYRAVPRGEEIARWRTDADHRGMFVILDDDSDMAEVQHRLVQTSMETGLMRIHADRAIEMLGGARG